MKRTFIRIALPALLAVAAVSCNQTDKNRQQAMIEPDTTLTEAEIQAGILTPEVMWKLARAGSSQVSPDGHGVVYALTRYSMAENKGVTNLYFTDLETYTTQQLTDSSANESDPTWNADGSAMYFLSDRSGETQLWRMDIILSKLMREKKMPSAVQLSAVEGGIEGYKVAPDGINVLYAKRVKVDGKRSSDKYADLDKSAALIYDGLMARHWNRWEDGTHLHIFTAQIGREPFATGTDILPDEPWDAPMAPDFDMDEIAWNHSSDKIAYTCKKLAGTQYAMSTDSDIYLYDLQEATTENLTQGMPGYDRYPRFSPDDRHLAFGSMARPGVESDKQRLMVLDLATKMKTDLTAGFDYSATNIEWDDESHLFFLAPMKGTLRLCYVPLNDDGNILVTLYGEYDINRFTVADGKMVAEIASISAPTELFKVDPYNGQVSQFTSHNTDIMQNIRMGRVEKHMVPTTDGKEMLTWIILPPDFDPAKKYPTLLYCQGGPQNTVSQFWSYRWNFQLMAAQGYVVVAPNRRGTPSFGQEWLDQISGDYSGQNIRDYLSAIDYACKEPYVDKDRLGCVGASYGGYSVFYLAGHHQKRFKAFIAHCGMFNLESMYGSTEELWFPNNDMGGPWWSDNATARRTYANSPHLAVRNWDTPILIITGANDFRIPYTESLQAFTAAQTQGIPSRLVFFENEAHQVFKPQNSLTWNREFFDWLQTYVKGE